MSKILSKYLLFIGFFLLTGATQLFANAIHFQDENSILQSEIDNHFVSEDNESTCILISNKDIHSNYIFINFILIEDIENENYSSNAPSPLLKTKPNSFSENTLTLGLARELTYNISKYNTNLYKSSLRLHVKLQVFII